MAGTRELIRASQREYEADIRLAADSTLRGDAPVFVPCDTSTTQEVYGDDTSSPYAYPQGYVDPAATVPQPAFMYDRADLQRGDYLSTSDAERQLEEPEQHSDSQAYGHPLVWHYEYPPSRHDEDARPDTVASSLWEREGAFNQPEQYGRSEGQADGAAQGVGADWSPTLLQDEANWNTSAADLEPDAPLLQDQDAGGRSRDLNHESFLDPLLRSTNSRVLVSTTLTSATRNDTEEGAGDPTSETLLPAQGKETALPGSARNYEKSTLDLELGTMPTQSPASSSPLTQSEGVGSTDVTTPASQYEDRANGVASTQSLQTGTNSAAPPSMSAGSSNTLRIDTQIQFTKEQKVESAKEEMALRPSQPIPINFYSINPLMGRPPALLREEGWLKQQNANWFSEFTNDELLHNMNPDDICGTLIIEMAKQYSGPEIAIHANQLYALQGKKAKTANNYTKRICNAVMHLCNGNKEDHATIIDALQQDRTTFRAHGQAGIKAEEEITRILGLAAQRARISKAAIEAARVAREKQAAEEQIQPSGAAVSRLQVPTYPSVPPNAPADPTYPLSSSAAQDPGASNPQSGITKASQRKRVSDDMESEATSPVKRVKASEHAKESV